MKTTFHLLTLTIACATLLNACGGDGGASMTAVLTPTTVAGTISGLGSIILNGVRYETIGATVENADDRTSIKTPMGLGMTVAVDPSSNSTVAGTIHVQTGIKGGTSLVNAAANSLNVAGLPVVADAGTFIVNSTTGISGNFAALLANNQNVEVYGLPQTDGTFKATRIEILTVAPIVQLVGAVSGLNTTSKTFTLGGNGNTVTVSYAGTPAPAGLINGAVISVRTNTSTNTANYTATSLYLRSASTNTFKQYAANYSGTTGINNEVNELYGMVSQLTATTTGCTLQVQGVPTTVSSTTLCNALNNGDYVEIKGLFLNGQLSTHKVEFKTTGGDRSLANYYDDPQDSNHDQLKYNRLLSSTTSNSPSSSGSVSSGSGEGASVYEIYGTLSNCASGAATSCTLTSNGVVYTADLSAAFWERGAATSGLVEAKGYMSTTNTFKVIKIESKQ